LIYWSPWDKPYEESKGPDRFSLTEILAGKWDTYIDSWGDGAKAFGKTFFVSFCNEMNGDWFPWSGCYYGGKNGGNEVLKRLGGMWSIAFVRVAPTTSAGFSM
jgi:hypothetical protein